MKNYISRLNKDLSEKPNMFTIPKVIKEITKQANYKQQILNITWHKCWKMAYYDGDNT